MRTLLRNSGRQISAIALCVLFSGCAHSPLFSPTTTSAAPSATIASSLMSGGAIQTVKKIKLPEPAKIIEPVCPGPGNANCEINWLSLQAGLSEDEVSHWLGQPIERNGPDIYVDKVVAQWKYEQSGVVYFENAVLKYADLPDSFRF